MLVATLTSGWRSPGPKALSDQNPHAYLSFPVILWPQSPPQPRLALERFLEKSPCALAPCHCSPCVQGIHWLYLLQLQPSLSQESFASQHAPGFTPSSFGSPRRRAWGRRELGCWSIGSHQWFGRVLTPLHVWPAVCANPGKGYYYYYHYFWLPWVFIVMHGVFLLLCPGFL